MRNFKRAATMLIVGLCCGTGASIGLAIAVGGYAPTLEVSREYAGTLQQFVVRTGYSALPFLDPAVRARKEFRRQEARSRAVRCACDEGADSTFRPEAWRLATSAERGMMAKDLICSGAMIGKPRAAALAQLGPPDEQRSAVFVYRVNRERPLGEGKCYVPPPPRKANVEMIRGGYDLEVRLGPSNETVEELTMSQAYRPMTIEGG